MPSLNRLIPVNSEKCTQFYIKWKSLSDQRLEGIKQCIEYYENDTGNLEHQKIVSLLRMELQVEEIGHAQSLKTIMSRCRNLINESK